VARNAFSRDRSGAIVVRLRDDYRELLRNLVAQLRELLLEGDDASLTRLYPTAYPDDEKRELEYRRLMRDTLLGGKLETLDAFEATIGNKSLTETELTTWMTSVNDLRLVLGTLLDVSEDEGDVVIDPDTQEGSWRILYHELSWLLEQIVAALSS
jgi:hypothetical protein